ncbi:MAG: sugar phosphate isomerase/epimerase [Lachnospiraceae bacterium]|nr:sugar phosphate isomerase/epimerase [Lachnospiraceae bacterium]
MKIEKLLMVPDYDQIEKSFTVAENFGCGFEYNDFYRPDFLENEKELRARIDFYKGNKRCPSYTTLHGAFLDVTVASDDPRILEVSDYRIEQSLQIARQLHAKAVIFHTNFIPNFCTDYYCASWIERNEAYWSKKLEKYNDINIYIENMFDMSYELLAQLSERLCVYPNFGICFDYAHAHAFGDETCIMKWVHAFAPYVKHIHINDNDLVNDLHLPLGDGKIDWKLFKEVYESYFPQATVLVEVKDPEDAEKSLQFIREL